MRVKEHVERWLETFLAFASGFSTTPFEVFDFTPVDVPRTEPKLVSIKTVAKMGGFVVRQASGLSQLSSKF